jgi:hypothetical protein
VLVVRTNTLGNDVIILLSLLDTAGTFLETGLDCGLYSVPGSLARSCWLQLSVRTFREATRDGNMTGAHLIDAGHRLSHNNTQTYDKWSYTERSAEGLEAAVVVR